MGAFVPESPYAVILPGVFRYLNSETLHYIIVDISRR